MKRYRIRLTVFLLVAVMLLAACGNAALEPETSAPSVEEPAEPRTYHIYVEKEVLAKETVPASSALPLMPGDPIWGTVLDRVTFYEYDLNGRPEQNTVYYSPDELLPEGLDIPMQRPEERMLTDENSGDILCVYSFSFDGEGRLIREKRELFADITTGNNLAAPLSDVFGFDAEGHLINWEREDSFAISYEYDSAGALVKKTLENEKGTETTQITRDADGKVLSTEVTQADGKLITYSFSYDDADRVISCESRGGRARTSLEIKYGSDGWPENMKIYSNGIRQKTERYSFEQKSDELTVGKARVSYPEADIFGGPSFTFSTPDKKTLQGNSCGSAEYELTVLDTRIRYMKTCTELEYRMIPVRSETDAGNFESLDSLDAFYPVLGRSYSGYVVPEQDGREVLRKVTVSSDLSDVIGNVTTIALDEYDRPSGEVCGFDLEALLDSDKIETDEQGRPVLTQNGSYTARFSYAGDMLSYRVVGDNPEFAYHSEREYALDERRPARIIALKDNEIFNNVNYHLEYTGDGLLTKYSYPGIYEYGFTYDFVADPGGKLSTVYFSGDEVPEGSVFMSFDEHGYLTRYTRILEHEILTFTYSYVETE